MSSSNNANFDDTKAHSKNAARETKKAVASAFDEATEAGKEAAEAARVKAEAAAEKGEEVAEEAAEKTKETAAEAKRKTEAAAAEAKRKGKAAAEETKEKAIEAKDTIVQKLREAGCVNPAGLTTAAFGAVFLAAVPVTSFLATQGGLIEKAVNGVCHSVAWLGTAGSTSNVAQTGKIAALSTLYLTMTYAFSGAGSAAGVDAGNKEGRDNLEPRAQVANLRGLPLRLYSAHYNMLEMFPGFAITAALAQAIAPADQSLINLLGLHVIAKVFVHYPAYLLNYGLPRSIAHIVATASVINVGLRLAKRPLPALL